MTELTALNVRITGDAGDLKAAVGVATGELGRVAQAAQQANAQSGSLTRGFAGVASGAGKSAGVLRGMTQQLSQVGQQTMATGNFLQALAIQLPDIGLGFGAIGTAAGLLAGIALPMLAASLTTSTAETEAQAAAAERLKGAFEGVATATADIQTKIDQLRFGVDEEYQVELLKEQIRLRDEITAKIAEGQQYLATTTDSVDRQRMVTEEINASVAKLANRHNEITGLLQQQRDRAVQLSIIDGQRAQRAGEIAAKQAETAEKTRLVEERLRAAGVSGDLLARMNFANIAAAQSYAEGLEQALASSANYASQLSAVGQSSGPDAVRTKLGGGGKFTPVVRGAGLPTPKAPIGGGGGGGGGGGVDPLQGELEALQQSLLSQEQIEAESHMRRLETLKSALEQRLLTQQEYAALMEQVERTHQFAMGKETREGISATLTALGGLFEGSKKIGAAIGLANSWLAFTEVLKDPAYAGRPWARFAAATQALASGLNAVRNIKSASPGGATTGGGGAVSSAAAGGGGGPLQVNLNTFGGGDFIRAADFGMILDKLNKEAGDRGYTILGVPA